MRKHDASRTVPKRHGLGLGLSLAAAALWLSGCIQGHADAIDLTTVASLRQLHAYKTGSRHGHGGAPMVDGQRAYILTPIPHKLIALDLADKPAVLWTYAPKADGRAEGLGCCGPVSQGVALADGRVVMASQDGRVTALASDTGRVLWEVQVADPAQGDTIAEAPRIVDGKVIVGSSGEEAGTRGWVAALDAATGRGLWKMYHAGPDAEVGIGPDFKPFYAADRGRDLGVTTWPPAGDRQSGGGLAGPVAYDPDQHLIFYATGHPAPWNPDQRPGRNAWTSGLFARDVATGAARWFVGFTPHDPFAYGAGRAGLLLDRPWHGEPRKLLVHADPNGFVYVIDRTSGEVLSSAAYVNVNMAEPVMPDQPWLRVRSERMARVNVMTRDICPGWPGALGGAPSLSPDGRFLLIPVSRLCMDMEARNVSFMSGMAYMGANIRAKRPRDGSGGALIAWDIEGARVAWSIDEAYPVASGVLALAGGPIFYGTLDGMLKAVDPTDGHLLWRAPVPGGIIGTPVTFADAQGQPLIAVLSGLGGPFGRVADLSIDPRDASAARGMGNALSGLAHRGNQSGALTLFGLP